MFLGDAAFMPLQLSSLSAAVPSLQLPKMAWRGGSSIHTHHWPSLLGRRFNPAPLLWGATFPDWITKFLAQHI